MEILYIGIRIYLTIGIILNLYGPLSQEIWIKQMNVFAGNSISKTKFFFFTCAIRTGVVLLYPIFIFTGI